MLSDALIRSTKPSSRPRKVSDGGGLHLLVAPNGGRYWRYSYRFHGKQKTLALGVYPDVNLAKARARHQAAREALADGTDPALKSRARSAPSRVSRGSGMRTGAPVGTSDTRTTC